MDEYIGFYDPIGITKGRICGLIAKSEAVRKALDYQAKDAPYKDEYDPDDPMTLIWNCIIPTLKDPDTITTADPQILVGIDSARNLDDPRTITLYGTIVVVVNNEDLRTNIRYIRPDLVEQGLCAYTKPDAIAREIRQALAAPESISWIGDIQFIESTEGSVNNTTHYSRVLKFMVREVNFENRGI